MKFRVNSHDLVAGLYKMYPETNWNGILFPDFIILEGEVVVEDPKIWVCIDCKQRFATQKVWAMHRGECHKTLPPLPEETSFPEFAKMHKTDIKQLIFLWEQQQEIIRYLKSRE